MSKEFIIIDLQFFGEKTEEPTQKKIDDTRKKGQVAQSKELTGALTLFLAVYMIKIFGLNIIKDLVKANEYFWSIMYVDNITNHGAFLILLYGIFFMIKSVAYIIIPVFITAFIVQRFQVGQLLTFDTIKPKLSKLNPIEGLKRMFSMQALMNLFKSLLKIFFVGYVGYAYIKSNIGMVLKSIQLAKTGYIGVLGKLSMELCVRMAVANLLIGIIDYIYQRYSYKKNLKMSKQEVKEEYKNTEGDPQIKSKIKQKQREAAQKRMMQKVPEADVIITNPTHFAVALKYDEEEKEAPFVLAKGKDLVAQKIKEIAKLNKVPIIENKPLARQLYKELEIGDMISQEMYEAVAQVLAYVYSLRRDSEI